MAGGRGLAAGKAYVELSMKDSKFQAAMNNIKGKFGKLKTVAGTVLKTVAKAFAAAGVAAAALFASISKIVHEFADFGDKLQKIGARTGISTEFISELKVVTELAGGSFTNLEKGLVKMQRRLANPAYQNKFKALGYDLEKIKKLEPEKRFTAIADSISKMSEENQLFAAQEMFGEKAGQELLLVLRNGSEEMLKQMDLAGHWGATVTQEQADMAAELNDTWLEIKTMFKGFTVQVGAYFTPWFQWLLDSFLFVVNNWKRFMAEAASFVYDQVSELYSDLAFMAENFTFGLVSDEKIQEFKDVANIFKMAAQQTSRNGIPGIGIDPYVAHGDDVKLGLSERSRDLKNHGVYDLLQQPEKLKRATAAALGGFGAGAAQLGKGGKVEEEQLEQLKDANDNLSTIIRDMGNGGTFA
jgi:hypothetical protein